MALGRATVVAPVPPKVRFFHNNRQVFAKNTALQFSTGDQLELFGTKYRVVDVNQTLDLETESASVDVTLSDSFARVAIVAEEV